MEYCKIAVDNGYAEAKPALDRHASQMYADGSALLKDGKNESALPLIVKTADFGNADALKSSDKK
jgi:hypothetical protein